MSVDRPAGLGTPGSVEFSPSVGGTGPTEPFSQVRAPGSGGVAKPGGMEKKPEVRFQRDLSSFPVQQRDETSLSDNQAIATDAKAALAMGVAAAGVPKAQSVGLIGGEAGVAGTAAKYGQFLGAMADFVEKPGDLDFEIFKAINAAATLMINTAATLGNFKGIKVKFS